jgi:hypothetical protein
VRDNGIGHRSTRIHAVILTRERSEALERCIATALSTLRACDALTVVDDSCARIWRANAAVLAEAARRSIINLTHLRAEQLHNAVAQAMGGSRALWQSKTAPRDIAPLRNLSLVVSTVVNAHTTVLVDDDICGFDLDATDRMLDAVDRGAGGMVAGAEIDGMTEQDTVTRLSAAMRLLESKAYHCAVPAEELFRVSPDSGNGRTGECGWVSAGYMAFRLPATKLFAFPPGYNEDWLWCLLHDASGVTRVFRVDQTVVHKPPLLRQPTRDDILFELSGDLILECFAERSGRRSRRSDTALEDLANHVADPSVMPSVRARTVLEQARHLSETGVRAIEELESYGLKVLRDMLRSGELEMDGNRTLSAWSTDATAKHKSFAATLGSTTVRSTFETMLQEGKL